ncbi:MFS transporter [Streptomyces heilongjiangensis]|uniref:MFS transporter n=1 Tax=Streptomyces heilongjiangensis TaxID=945052 RepID=A0ABW1B1Y1_9ACTN|nr:MFS transporter [Streptomyces heilongjiangensis]MDC2950924.1 MFS transporter [Streptomyces heilongjiangensis]
MASEETLRTASVSTPVPDRIEPPGGRMRPGTRAWTTRLMVLGIALTALNLRPAITSLGALLEEVRDGLGMSGSVAGLLTSVPPLCFAVFGSLAPRLARRFGPAAVVCAGMAAIATGLVVRPYTGTTAGFVAASALALMGIAVSNVLMPVIVKSWFPDRVGSMTGLYSMALALGTSAAAAVTVPLTEALGGSWQTGLTAWATLAAVAVLPWLPFVRNGSGRDTGRAAEGAAVDPAVTSGSVRKDAVAGSGSVRKDAVAGSGSVRKDGTTGSGSARRDAPRGAGAVPDDVAAPRITRSRTAWALAVFFGLQATAAYITMGWMPQIFRDAGVPADTAGVLLAVTMVMGVPVAFVIPRLATRLPHQGPIAVALGLCGLLSYAGLYLAPAGGAWVWALLLGVSNCSFPLALTLVGMRARTGEGVAKLSAFAQSTGYLISIPGPLLVGVLYQHSGGWGLPLALMAALMVPQIAVGALAGRDRMIEDETAATAR